MQSCTLGGEQQRMSCFGWRNAQCTGFVCLWPAHMLSFLLTSACWLDCHMQGGFRLRRLMPLALAAEGEWWQQYRRLMHVLLLLLRHCCCHHCCRYCCHHCRHCVVLCLMFVCVCLGPAAGHVTGRGRGSVVGATGAMTETGVFCGICVWCVAT